MQLPTYFPSQAKREEDTVKQVGGTPVWYNLGPAAGRGFVVHNTVTVII